MQVSGVLAQLPFVLARDRQVVVGLGTGSHVDVTETARFFDGLFRPDTGLDVVGDTVFRQQVQRYLGELLAGSPCRNSTL